MRWVLQCHRVDNLRARNIRHVNQRDRIRHSVQNPGLSHRSIVCVLQSDASRDGSHINAAEKFAAGRVNGK